MPIGPNPNATSLTASSRCNAAGGSNSTWHASASSPDANAKPPIAHDGLRLYGLRAQSRLTGRARPARVRIVGPSDLPAIDLNGPVEGQHSRAVEPRMVRGGIRVNF